MRTVSPNSYPEPAYLAPSELHPETQRYDHDTRWQVFRKNVWGALHAIVTYYANRRRIRRHDYKLRPLIGSYYVTHRCNLKCLYCTEHYPIRDTVDADTEGAFEILQKIRKECQAIYFTGGEPLVRPDIIEIVREAARLKFFPIYLGTNALLLPLRDKVVDYVDRLVISLDSLDAQAWDRILNAGRGQAQKIYGIIAHYAAQQRKRDLSILINCVITHDSIEQVYRVMEFCFRHDMVFAPVSATIDSLADPTLLARPDYHRLVKHILDLKRRGYPILGSVESIETLLLGKKYPCYAMALPHIYPNGDIFYPCQPLGKIGGNLLELGSISEAYREGERKYGPWKECWRSCGLNCYVLTNYYIHHFWDQMVIESVAQFAMQPGTGRRLEADAALEPLFEDPRSWQTIFPVPEPAPLRVNVDVPLASLAQSD